MTSLVALDGSIGQLDIIFAGNEPHQILKTLSLHAVSIQSVKSILQDKILRKEYLGLLGVKQLLLRSQHRHPPLSAWIFFVILEAAFPTGGRPSTGLLFLLHWYHASTLTGIKGGYYQLPGLSRPTAYSGLFHTFPAFHVPTILSLDIFRLSL